MKKKKKHSSGIMSLEVLQYCPSLSPNINYTQYKNIIPQYRHVSNLKFNSKVDRHFINYHWQTFDIILVI